MNEQTDDEFKKTLGFHMPVSPEDDIAPEPITRRRSTMLRSLAIPDKVDWRERGFVTPVKAQVRCFIGDGAGGAVAQRV